MKRGFGKRSLRHLRRVAEEITELEGVVVEAEAQSFQEPLIQEHTLNYVS